MKLPSKLAAKARLQLDRLRHPDSFMGPVITLVGGAAMAHGITAFTLVAIARLYTPGQVGVLGLFASIFYIFAVVACLRFDLAIPLPKEDEEARDIFWLAVLSGICLSASMALVLLFVPNVSIARLGLEKIAPYLWMLPLAVLTGACFAALQSWHIRMRNYGLMAGARIAQSAGASGVQISGGLLSPSPLSLIAGFVLNGGAAALVVLAQMWRKNTLAALKPKFSQLKPTLKQYSYYPLFSTWEALANSASIQLPILLIGVLISEAEVGQLLLASSVVQAPMSLFGTAASQVFLSQAPERARQGQLRDIVRATVKSLCRIGIPTLGAIGIASPFLFPVIFGEEWARAGMIVAWLTPWLLLQFIASPIFTSLYIMGKLKFAMWLQLGCLAFRMSTTYFGAIMLDGRATEAYAVSGAFFYAFLIASIMWFLRK